MIILKEHLFWTEDCKTSFIYNVFCIRHTHNPTKKGMIQRFERFSWKLPTQYLLDLTKFILFQSTHVRWSVFDVRTVHPFNSTLVNVLMRRTAYGISSRGSRDRPWNFVNTPIRVPECPASPWPCYRIFPFGPHPTEIVYVQLQIGVIIELLHHPCYRDVG